MVANTIDWHRANMRIEDNFIVDAKLSDDDGKLFNGNDTGWLAIRMQQC